MHYRDSEEINKDVKKVKEAAVIARNLEEVAILTDLSPHQVTTTLSQHPIIKKRVLAQLKANRQKESEKKLQENRKQTETKKEESQTKVDQAQNEKIDLVQPQIKIVFEIPKTYHPKLQGEKNNQNVFKFYSIKHGKIRVSGLTKNGEPTIAHVKGKKAQNDEFYYLQNGNIVFYIRRFWNKILLYIFEVVDVDLSLVKTLKNYKIYNEKIKTWNCNDRELNDFVRNTMQDFMV